jgi:hypothetical protein
MEEMEGNAMFIFLDMEKAFDRCSWEFMLTGMERMGFGPNFVQMIKMMYDDGNPPERRIFANGYYSEWFEIYSGVAQGCPVSPLLFLIIAQGLAVAIKDAEIEGIKIKAVEIILAQFADDTTVFLRNWAELRRVSKPIQKWCGATAMRENITKREALAMGSYRKRTVPQDLRNIAWAKEGEWIRSLGVPIGNELDHALFWKKKIQATRDKANRWAGLCRSSYFGRNLIVQAMFFGSLRYWLYTIKMDQHTKNKIQHLADILWWKPDPDLRDANVKIKRWVRKKTAIGPKNKGGMNNMDWTIHSEGFTSEWFIRYAHPTQSAWKEILNYMLFTDKQGNLTVKKQVLLYSKLTNAQKLKLLHKLPKTAKYIRTCLTDFWKLNLTPTKDLKRRVIASESIWFNHSFDVQINWRTRKYLQETTEVNLASDIMNHETNRPFSR